MRARNLSTDGCPRPAPYALLPIAIIILAATVAVRGSSLGDPNYHVDESFYLLVGDRMRDGALPYVDVWDRKPFGLFLLYWGLAWLGGGAVQAVQIAAIASVAATATLLAAMAHRWTCASAALLVALSYVAGLEALAGGGGQSPVFYNLPVTAMAWLAQHGGGATDREMTRRRAAAAAWCGGLALTIKPTCLPECLLFGAMVSLNVARCGRDRREVWRNVAALVGLGLAPTLACVLFFAARGHAGDYVDATVLSALRREAMPVDERLATALYLMPRIAPSICLAAAGVALMRRRSADDARWLLAWITAALLGFLMVPNFYDHYALPLLPSLSLAAAPVFARRPLGPAFAAIAIAVPLLLSAWPATGRSRASIVAMTRAVRTIERHGGARSLYVFDGPPALYTLTHAPLPTRWAFPEHLSTSEERRAIGVDPVTEVAAILRHRPAVIVAADGGGPRHAFPVTHRLVQAALAARYRRVATVYLPDVTGGRFIGVFALRSAAAPRS